MNLSIKTTKENIRNKSIDEFIYMSEIVNKINENRSNKRFRIK